MLNRVRTNHKKGAVSAIFPDHVLNETLKNGNRNFKNTVNKYQKARKSFVPIVSKL